MFQKIFQRIRGERYSYFFIQVIVLIEAYLVYEGFFCIEDRYSYFFMWSIILIEVYLVYEGFFCILSMILDVRDEQGYIRRRLVDDFF